MKANFVKVNTKSRNWNHEEDTLDTKKGRKLNKPKRGVSMKRDWVEVL